MEVLSWLLTYELPERHLGDFIEFTNIVYDPDPENSHIELRCFDFLVREKSPWVLYIQSNRAKISNLLVWKAIQEKIEMMFSELFFIVEPSGFGEEVEPQLALRAYATTIGKLRNGARSDRHNFYTYMTEVEREVRKLFVAGIENIKTVKVRKQLALFPHIRDNLHTINTDKHEEYYFECEGSNLQACLRHFALDSQRTISNNIQ